MARCTARESAMLLPSFYIVLLVHSANSNTSSALPQQHDNQKQEPQIRSQPDENRRRDSAIAMMVG